MTEISLKIKSFHKTHKCTINNGTKISELKKLVEKEFGVKKNSQRLLFGGQLLEDSHTLKHYSIENDNTILLVKNDQVRSPATSVPLSPPQSPLAGEYHNHDDDETSALISSILHNLDIPDDTSIEIQVESTVVYETDDDDDEDANSNDFDDEIVEENFLEIEVIDDDDDDHEGDTHDDYLDTTHDCDSDDDGDMIEESEKKKKKMIKRRRRILNLDDSIDEGYHGDVEEDDDCKEKCQSLDLFQTIDLEDDEVHHDMKSVGVNTSDVVCDGNEIVFQEGRRMSLVEKYFIMYLVYNYLTQN